MSRAGSLLAATVLLACGAGARAGQMGREGSTFTALAGDSRSASLGSPAGGLIEGEAGMFANPAAIALEPALAFGFTQLVWPDAFYGETLAAQLPAGHGAALGLAAFAFLHDVVPLTSELLPEGTGADANLLHAAASVSGAQYLVESLAVGATLRVTHAQLGDDLREGLAADLGAVWVVAPDLRVGAAVRNLGMQVEPRRTRDPLPLSLDASVRYELADLAVPVRAYAGGRLPAYGPPSGGLAVEGGEIFGASLRCALEIREYGGLTWAFGLGAHRDLWRLDYALSPAGALGLAHRFGVTLRFGSANRDL